MRAVMFWFLDRLLLVLAFIYVLVDASLGSYEKCILVGLIGNMVVLKNIKDVIEDGFKNLLGSK